MKLDNYKIVSPGAISIRHTILTITFGCDHLVHRWLRSTVDGWHTRIVSCAKCILGLISPKIGLICILNFEVLPITACMKIGDDLTRMEVITSLRKKCSTNEIALFEMQGTSNALQLHHVEDTSGNFSNFIFV